jgi:hypothetical protein
MLFVAVHESGNGMARPRPALSLRAAAEEALRKAQRSMRCAHLGRRLNRSRQSGRPRQEHIHLVGLDKRGAIVLQQKVSRGQLERRLANIPRCLIGMEACSGSHHIGRQLAALGHDVRLIPAQYVKPFLKGHKNDYRDAGAIAPLHQHRDRPPPENLTQTQPATCSAAC